MDDAWRQPRNDNPITKEDLQIYAAAYLSYQAGNSLRNPNNRGHPRGLYLLYAVFFGAITVMAVPMSKTLIDWVLDVVAGGISLLFLVGVFFAD